MDQGIVLTDHAIGEARRRGISEAVILRVANTPEQRIPVSPAREVRQSRVTDTASGKLHLLRVVVEFSPRGVEVITAYRTSKLRKYWRDE